MLLADSTLFGLTLFGDGATIKTIPMINALAAGVNNPFALLDVFDCSEHCSKAGKKDASLLVIVSNRIRAASGSLFISWHLV